MFKNFFPENRAVCEIMRKNVVELEATDDNVIRRMRFACWVSKAIRTHAQKYVRPISFLRQQRSRERASILHYTYIACLIRLVIRWVWEVSLATRPLYPWGNSLLYALNWRLDGSQSRSRRLGKEPRIERRFLLSCSAPSRVTIPTELFRLPHERWMRLWFI
jgi:hypothetical protein